MPSFEFHYIVTYENGKIRSPGDRSIMRVELSDEEYVKIAVGLSEGKELMSIPDIEDVLERMKQRVVEYDVYYSLDGRLKSKPSTRQRKISAVEVSAQSWDIDRFRRMKDPRTELSRPAQSMTIYRSDGSSVELCYRRGEVEYRDSRKSGSVGKMTADRFLDLIVH